MARDRYAAVPAEATDTPAFKAWFGGSKIKANGRPAVVYHGSAEEIAAFSHDKLGTGLSELGFSLIQTCKALGIDPEVYLKDVLTRLPTTQQKDIDALLPHYWSPGTSSTSDQANPTADAA